MDPPLESLKFALLPKPNVGSADQCFPDPGGRPLAYHEASITEHEGHKACGGVKEERRALPEVVAVERFAGQLPVPEDEVDLVPGVGRGDVAAQLRPPALHCPDISDGN